MATDTCAEAFLKLSLSLSLTHTHNSTIVSNMCDVQYHLILEHRLGVDHLHSLYNNVLYMCHINFMELMGQLVM